MNLGLSNLGLIWEFIQIYGLFVSSLLAMVDALIEGTLTQSWGLVYSNSFTRWQTLIVTDILA